MHRPRLEPLEARRLLSTIAGTVFDDVDGSGTFDSGETGIENRIVYLDDDDDGIRDNGEEFVQTASDGTYIFLSLSAGTFNVRQVVPFGFDQTTPPNDDGFTVFLSNGQDVENQDFGTIAVPVITGSIAGVVYDDADADGTVDVGEVGASGRTVFLDDDNNGTLDVTEVFTTTDVDGSYLFDLLEIKSYNVRSELPTGWRQTFPLNDAALVVTLTNGDRDQTGKDILTTDKPVATFSGNVFNDENRDGVKDTGEDGLQGITIFLDLNTDGNLDSGEPTRTTDSNGNYAFTNIDIGTYEVNQVLQANWLQTSPVNDLPQNITLIADDNLTNIDFGTATIPGSITGSVFDDLNNNGALDSGETGIAARTVYLDTDNDGTLDAGERSVVTDANGVYVFDALEIQAYNIRTILPQGWKQTLPVNNAAQSVTLSGGNRDVTDIDFLTVFDPSASVSGTVYFDKNRNRIKDPGEAGVAGVRVYLDANDNGLFDVNESNVLTNGSGAYAFSNIDIGTYNIRQVLQTNWIQTFPASNAARIVVLDVDDNITDVDLGTAPLPGSISGTLFEDADADGKLDTGEAAIGGFTIYIDANNNGSLDGGETSTITNGKGAYTFSNLDPGTYVIRPVIPTGYRVTTVNFYSVTLAARQNVTGRNFGMTARGNITGTVFNDANTSRTRDTGEVGLRGWKVYLDRNQNGRFDAGETFALTDSNGDFNISSVIAGTYQVRVVQFSKFKLTTPIIGYYSASLAASGTTSGLLFGQKIV